MSAEDYKWPVQEHATRAPTITVRRGVPIFLQAATKEWLERLREVPARDRTELENEAMLLIVDLLRELGI